MPEVLSVLADRDTLPSEIGTLIRDSEVDPDFFRQWFRADTPAQVDEMVQRLSDLTRRYATKLLQGDDQSFRDLEEYSARKTELWNRRRWLKELPPEIATECRNLPTTELERRRNEYHKERILAKEGERVADIRDLPADEFLKRHLSRQLGQK
jgi:hypothetical protein